MELKELAHLGDFLVIVGALNPVGKEVVLSVSGKLFAEVESGGGEDRLGVGKGLDGGGGGKGGTRGRGSSRGSSRLGSRGRGRLSSRLSLGLLLSCRLGKRLGSNGLGGSGLGNWLWLGLLLLLRGSRGFHFLWLSHYWCRRRSLALDLRLLSLFGSLLRS